MLQQYTGKAVLDILCAVLVMTLQDGCSCTGENAKETHQDLAWVGGL